jgi:endonuclease YncB( thermonuclease family)
MYVLLGYNSHNPDVHCSDGDSVYITGSAHNELVRLLGIDAFEVRGLNLEKLEECKFFYVLDSSLRKHLEPRLTDESIETHKQLGFKAKDYLEEILKENLSMTFGKEVFDRHGRALVYLSH